MSPRTSPNGVSRAADVGPVGTDALSIPTPPKLIDAKAAGELLCVPASWVLAEARAKRIPHVRLGRYVRFNAAELEVWWRAKATGPWRTGSDPVARRRDAA